MKTPRGMRLHISLYGRRNVGKSSLFNALTGSAISIVSDEAGTTTDPVRKAMEIHPIGPVLFTDTAGIDDAGHLGLVRVDKTLKTLAATEVALLVTDATWGKDEEDFFQKLHEKKIPIIVVFNKVDLTPVDSETYNLVQKNATATVRVSALTKNGIENLLDEIRKLVPESHLVPDAIVSDLVGAGGLAVLVVPIDPESPRGRLILPQVQTIRDLLDGDGAALVVKERELQHYLQMLNRQPDLVVTDSQAVLKVDGDLDIQVPLTTFSILFSRFKGNLELQAAGTRIISDLKPGDRVIIAEACTHHSLAEDIGRVKIPRWLNQYVGGALKIEVVSGHQLPKDISDCRLIIQCGACMWNRKEVTNRLEELQERNIAVTNYGLAIAYLQGVFERCIAPFGLSLNK